MDLQSPAVRRKITTPGKDFSEASEMQNRNRPTANKTTWSKHSSDLLVKIVKDVEQKILKKELLVGKANEKTKWGYVAAFLHEASPHDAGKTPNNCSYKFWELNRQHKLLIKESTGNSPPAEKIKKLLQRTNKENPPQMIENSSLSAPVLFNDARSESEDDSGGSLRHSSGKDSVVHLATPNQGVEQVEDSAASPLHHPNVEVPEQPRKRGRPKGSVTRKAIIDPDNDDLEAVKVSKRNSSTRLKQIVDKMTHNQGVEQVEDSARSPLHHPNVEVAEQLRRTRGRPKGTIKRKAIDPEIPDLEALTEKVNNSNRVKQLVDRMARLTSYMKWKQTGVGEDWRCVLTDRVERRQKRSMRTPIKNGNQRKAEETETQVPDEIEAVLREDILSCWNELDKKRPSAEECHKYFLKKCAGEVYW